MWCTNILGSTGSGSRLSNYCGGGKETVELNYKKVTVIREPGYEAKAVDAVIKESRSSQSTSFSEAGSDQCNCGKNAVDKYNHSLCSKCTSII